MSGSEVIHFGIAGLGNIASTHARAILYHDSASVGAACSRGVQNRQKFQEEFDLPVYATMEELLRHQPLHAVTICTPTGTHLEVGVQAAEAGKHVIVEKPIEVTIRKARRLIDCCRENGVQLAVIYQNRFSKGAIRIKEALDKGLIGEPIMARAAVKWFRSDDYYQSSDWRGTLNLDGGGAVINQSIHTLDLMTWFLGEAEAVSAYKGTCTHKEIEAEDNAVAIIRFQSGVMAVFEASTSIVPAQPRRIEINGTEGTLLLIDDESFLLTDSGSEPHEHESHGEAGTGAGASDPMSGLGFQHHASQYAQIIDAIRSGGEPAVSGEESLHSLAIVESIYRSSEWKREVLVKDVRFGRKC